MEEPVVPPKLLDQQSTLRFWYQPLPLVPLSEKEVKPSPKFKNKLEQGSKCPRQMIFIREQLNELGYFKVG